MILIWSNIVFSQEKTGDSIRKCVVIDLCKYFFNGYDSLYQAGQGKKFVVLNVDLNYRAISIGSGLYSERYRYGDDKYDSLLLGKIEKEFSLSREHNFILKNDYQDFEFLKSGLASNDSILALNNFDGFNYLKIGKPVEGWDMLYIMNDSISFFKYYKKLQGDVKNLSLNIPVIEYKYSKGVGVEYKYIFQYLIIFKNQQHTIKLLKKIDL